jgi:hypothetical protein
VKKKDNEGEENDDNLLHREKRRRTEYASEIIEDR